MAGFLSAEKIRKDLADSRTGCVMYAVAGGDMFRLFEKVDELDKSNAALVAENKALRARLDNFTDRLLKVLED